MALGEDTGGAFLEDKIDGDHDVGVDTVVEVDKYPEEDGKEAPHADIPCVDVHSSSDETPQTQTPSFDIPKTQTRSSESVVDVADIEVDHTPSTALAASKRKGKPYSGDTDEHTASSLMEVARTRPCELVVDVDKTGVDQTLLSGETTLAASTAADQSEAVWATCSADEVGVVASLSTGTEYIDADDVLVNNSIAECQMLASSVSAPCEITFTELNRSSCVDAQSLHTSPVYAELAEGAIEFLVESLIGCGNTCPFCGAPCALNSSQHSEHTAGFHRAQIITGYSSVGARNAAIETCSAYIASDGTFMNKDTKWLVVPYRSYKTIYPTWNIPPDTTLESSMFWKWLIVTRVSEFAPYYSFREESLPQAWKAITWEMVSQELNQMLREAGEEEEEPHD